MFDGRCEIRRAGITSHGRAQLDLKYRAGSFDWGWNYSTPEASRAVLAVALAAIASKLDVYCTIPDSVAAGATVANFGIVA
jgi:hypothetical protein